MQMQIVVLIERYCSQNKNSMFEDELEIGLGKVSDENDGHYCCKSSKYDFKVDRERVLSNGNSILVETT